VKGKDYLGDLCVDGSIILKWLKETGAENVDWIHLAQSRIQLSLDFYKGNSRDSSVM
jgi:hypothetical protein